MLRHYITKYRDEEDGYWYAESWVQLNLFGQYWCLSRKRVEIWAPPHVEPQEKRGGRD